MLKQILGKFLSRILPNRIVSKSYKSLNKKLYYEQVQHLTFLLKKKITYEPIIQNKLRSCIKKGDLVFDVGANIGQYALLFSELVGEKGRVVCFEPDFKNYAFLNFNVLINACKNVKCLNIGLGRENQILQLLRDTKQGGRTSSFSNQYTKTSLTQEASPVEVKKISEMITQFGTPDLIKTDVEVFEEFVIKGSDKPLTNTIYLIEVRQDTKKPVFEFFDTQDFTCYYIDNYANRLIEKYNVIPEFGNLLFIPKTSIIPQFNPRMTVEPKSSSFIQISTAAS